MNKHMEAHLIDALILVIDHQREYITDLHPAEFSDPRDMANDAICAVTRVNASVLRLKEMGYNGDERYLKPITLEEHLQFCKGIYHCFTPAGDDSIQAFLVDCGAEYLDEHDGPEWKIGTETFEIITAHLNNLAARVSK